MITARHRGRIGGSTTTARAV